ncbi:MAG TPA: FixH family protein [Woeseiaceae bacterium]|nr:FixH family protein [Woeseiaceae bacterium]
MIVHRISIIFLLFFVFGHNVALAHGGVVEEDDLCVIKVNYLRAHFKVYQPATRGLEQFCEDLPTATQSIFVMEYQHDSLSQMEVDFRIIRDVTGKGRFARLEDVEQIADIEGATVFYQAPVVEPDVYLVSHEFVEEGDFVGIVSARQMQSGKLYTAVFPFEVGFTGLGYWPFFIALLVILQIQYLYMSGRLRKWFGRNTGAASLLLVALFFAMSDAKASGLRVSFTAPEGQPRINQMHSWILHIVDESGRAVEGAIVEVDGGMPKHDHGLPTKPRVTEELGGGDYKLEGLRFHMSGYWEILVRVTTDAGTTVVTMPLQL